LAARLTAPAAAVGANLLHNGGFEDGDRDLAGAKYGVFQVVLVLGGEVWIDGAEVMQQK